MEEAYTYVGAVDRLGKIEFLRSLDALSVPTTYRDPKGLFVLEALAAGVPVVQPAHGAFPELLESLGGGRLVPPNDAQRLAHGLHQLLIDEESRRRLSQQGCRAVHERFNAEAMARGTLATLRPFFTLSRPLISVSASSGPVI